MMLNLYNEVDELKHEIELWIEAYDKLSRKYFEVINDGHRWRRKYEQLQQELEKLERETATMEPTIRHFRD